MKIGIKYCGGCQSKYNRRKVVDEIINKNSNQNDFYFVEENGVYDLIVVVSGCQIKCASISKYITKNGYLEIDCQNYQQAQKLLAKKLTEIKF